MITSIGFFFLFFQSSWHCIVRLAIGFGHLAKIPSILVPLPTTSYSENRCHSMDLLLLAEAIVATHFSKSPNSYPFVETLSIENACTVPNESIVRFDQMKNRRIITFLIWWFKWKRSIFVHLEFVEQRENTKGLILMYYDRRNGIRLHHKHWWKDLITEKLT